jgi:hypothetical protein
VSAQTPVLFLLALALAGSSGFAQGPGYPLWDAVGPAQQSGFGISVAGVGDVNGDGVPDVVVGAPEVLGPGGLALAGQARVLSGANGATLFVVSGTNLYGGLGAAVAGVGDVSGDGVPDLAVGAPEIPFDPFFPTLPGTVRVLSGATGGVLFTVTGTATGDRFGHSISALGDVSGDGVPDFVVGAIQQNQFGASGPGLARVVSGATGATLATATGTATGDAFGYSVAGVGDVSGDGIPDFLAGAPRSIFSFPPPAAGYARLLSGAGGATLFTFNGTATADGFGFAVGAAGDLNGDGALDLAVTAPKAGAARVFSGTTGGVLLAVGGVPAVHWFGTSIVGGQDVNLDGVPDLLVGAAQPPASGFGWGTGYLRALSGSSGAALFDVEGSVAGEQFGFAAAAVGDANADGFTDLVVGSPDNTPAGALSGSAGRVSLVALVGLAPGSSRFGSGCPGTGGVVPIVSEMGGWPLPGNGDFAIALSKALPGTPTLRIVGVSDQSWLGAPLPLNLAPIGLPGCSLLVSVDVVFPATTTAGGAALIALPIPLDPFLAATFVYFQWYVVDPGPLPVPGAMSRGLKALIL